MKINLVEQIKKDLPFLGVEIPQEKTAKALTFFLNQDIEKIFGKVEFESFENGKEIEYEKIVTEQNRFINITMPIATTDGIKKIKFIINLSLFNDGIWIFVITHNNSNSFISLTIKEDQVIHYQDKVQVKEKVEKIAASQNGQCVFTYQVNDTPVISATPINVKTGEYSYYEIIKGMEKQSPSFLKSIADIFTNKNIHKIRTGYGLTDDFDYLEEIFAILESEDRNKEQKLIRNKED